jgi:exoribonuclease R
MSKASKLLEEILGVKQFQDKQEGIRGILQTKDYSEFIILSDGGDELIRFTGAKFANKCLPGDHIAWNGEKCILELRDEHPPIIGTLELTNKSKYGLTSRGIPIYLFTPYNKSYPHFIVGCSEKDVSKNRIGLIKFDDWSTSSTFPRGQLQQILGISGDFEAEKQALIWQACPWKYPKGNYKPESKEQIFRTEISGFTFNIDPEGCKDIDDVLTFQQIEKDKWIITITISDVATYVEDGGVVDIFASLIGQTLYDNNGTILRPMLPKEYSEDICSLLENKESFGISLQFEWNGREILNKRWIESIIKNNKSYTYEEFEKTDSPYRNILAKISSYLAKENISGQYKILEDSHKWIEYMMLFYNMEAGRILKEEGMGILRRHSAPNIEKLEKYKKYLPDFEKLAYSSAEYCLANESETNHFGLESTNYAHVSSPIRRYADLVNQRVLKMYIRNIQNDYIVPITMYDMNYRAKLIKGFSRDIDFLKAITSGETIFKGIILDKKVLEDNLMKIKIYIPLWKRSISTKYKMIDENTVLSRDEKRKIEINEYEEVEIKCALNINSRNWKERIIINIYKEPKTNLDI